MSQAPKFKFTATQAKRESVLLRLALCGPTGSGKTKTGMIVGTRLVERLKTGPLFVIDSEARSAVRYAYSQRSQQGYNFMHVPMPDDDFSPGMYVDALDFCEAEGAGVIMIDSLSHVWEGLNGILEQVDRVTQSARTKNSFSDGWKTMTPIYNRLVQRLISTGCHIIFTLRAKTHYEIEKNDNGKNVPVKVGTAPIIRAGFDYEVDAFASMAAPDNTLTVDKSRIDQLAPGEVIRKPGPDFADTIIDWMKDAEPTTGARTLGEAIMVATSEGIAAAQAKDPDAYKAARAKLGEWCVAHGLKQDRIDTSVAQFKERVAAVTGKGPGPKPAPAPPASDADTKPMTDAERIADIDRGAA